MFKGFSRFNFSFLRRHLGSIILIGLLILVIVFSQIYKEYFVVFGNGLLLKYHKTCLYAVLFFLAAISSTLIPLPVWIYVFTSVALGFNYVECAVVLGLDSSLGSTSSYVLGRFFHNTRYFKKRVPSEKIEKWKSHSRAWGASVLFFGTISPLPMDFFYAAAGLLHFPISLFLLLVTTARIIRYVLMGYVFFVVYPD